MRALSCIFNFISWLFLLLLVVPPLAAGISAPKIPRIPRLVRVVAEEITDPAERAALDAAHKRYRREREQLETSRRTSAKNRG